MNRSDLGHTLETSELAVLGLLLLGLRLLLLGRLQQPMLSDGLSGAGLVERACQLLKDLRMLKKLL